MTSKRHNGATIVTPERAHAKEIQHFGSITNRPIALEASVRATSVENLNQVLADTMTLRDMYKKHHWQVAGPTFYQLHLLFDKHYDAQSELVDLLAERIQSLGGVSIAMAPDVAELTLIPRPPRGREDGARADLPAPARPRDHPAGGAGHGAAGGRGRRRRHQRLAGQRPDPHW
jgi:Ferritin-like domain